MADRGPVVTGFHGEVTDGVAYVAADPATGCCAIIDPMLDFDRTRGGTHTRSADRIVAFVWDRGLTVEWVLDTRPHAGPLSAAAYLKGVFGAPMATGEHVVIVREVREETHASSGFPATGSRWDRLFEDGDRFRVGELEAEVFCSSGRVAASTTYAIGDAAFVHDALFVPDGGTTRAGSPRGDTRALRRILSLPPRTRLFAGRGHRPDGWAPRWETTVADQLRSNPHLRDGVTESESAREHDRTPLPPGPPPDALRVNVGCGYLPEPGADGARRPVPLDRFREARCAADRGRGDHVAGRGDGGSPSVGDRGVPRGRAPLKLVR